jgi:hypothetical protein
MSNHIFWLSSYPKSGNTLLRSILVSLFFTEDGNFNLKLITKIKQFETDNLIYRNKNIFKNDYSKINDIAIFYKYILKLQEKQVLKIDSDFQFFKTHSGNFIIGDSYFTKKENIRGLIYIIRDPRDVCVSWSKHKKSSIDDTIKFMTNATQTLWWGSEKEKIFDEKDKPSRVLSSWDKHVTSWTTQSWDVPSMVIRYEDLVFDKKNTIFKIVEFFSKNFNFEFKNIEKKIENILLTTQFEKFQKHENKYGFAEAPEGNKFFSVGKSEQWLNKLSTNQVKKIENAFKKTMDLYNYKIIS